MPTDAEKQEMIKEMENDIDHRIDVQQQIINRLRNQIDIFNFKLYEARLRGDVETEIWMLREIEAANRSVEENFQKLIGIRDEWNEKRKAILAS
jgi:hypothetical protein